MKMMKALASYIMRGQAQAIVVAAGFAMLSMIFPLFSLLSAAAVAFVSLRQGAAAGLILVVACGVLLVTITLVTGSISVFMPGIASLMVLLLLLWVFSIILRYTRSLPVTLAAAGAVGLVFIIVFHLVVGDTVLWWQSHFKAFFAHTIEAMMADQQLAFTESLQSLATIMTGFVTMAFLLNAILSLFIARSWQAALYNPGGFREEFHRLQLGKKVAIFSLVIATLALIPLAGMSYVMKDMLLIVMMLYILQGVAVVHAIVAMKNMQWVWLVGLYGLVFLMSQLVAITGYIDTWLDFRKRMAPSTTKR
ncbi:MAG: DUF2232 domain-containing protein [Gammaproteobacteria bacterium]|nr:DUF2232 domain-containing protein [Gammaproteobacteria bacterium]